MSSKLASRNPLILAVELGYTEICKLLLENDANPCFAITDGGRKTTALHTAVIQDRHEILDTMMMMMKAFEGQKINQRDGNRRTALLVAIEKDSFESIIILLDRPLRLPVGSVSGDMAVALATPAGSLSSDHLSPTEMPLLLAVAGNSLEMVERVLASRIVDMEKGTNFLWPMIVRTIQKSPMIEILQKHTSSSALQKALENLSPRTNLSEIFKQIFLPRAEELNFDAQTARGGSLFNVAICSQSWMFALELLEVPYVLDLRQSFLSIAHLAAMVNAHDREHARNRVDYLAIQILIERLSADPSLGLSDCSQEGRDQFLDILPRFCDIASGGHQAESLPRLLENHRDLCDLLQDYGMLASWTTRAVLPTSSHRSQTAFFGASRRRDRDLLRRILALPDVDAAAREGWVQDWIRMSIICRRTEEVACLLDVVPSLSTETILTAFATASLPDPDLELSSLIHSSSIVNIDSVNVDGGTALTRAIRRGKAYQVVNLFSFAGVDLDAAGPNGGEVLMEETRQRARRLQNLIIHEAVSVRDYERELATLSDAEQELMRHAMEGDHEESVRRYEEITDLLAQRIQEKKILATLRRNKDEGFLPDA